MFIIIARFSVEIIKYLKFQLNLFLLLIKVIEISRTIFGFINLKIKDKYITFLKIFSPIFLLLIITLNSSYR